MATRFPPQVPRLALIFLVAFGGLVVARAVLIPDTFGDRGHYRAAAVDTIVAHAMKYAGHQECIVCHSEVQTARLAGNHRGVTCEVCHGPAANHVAAPLDVKPTAPRERTLCPLCHAYNPSRPTGFPQIDPVSHNPMTPCITCHSPHAPVPPVTPEECSACHGQIARQKAFSPHVQLPCTTCHEVPTAHKVNPLSTRPTKPQTREFCGQCHAQDARSPTNIPRVDMRTHGERYTCWQCHYPHYPET